MPSTSSLINILAVYRFKLPSNKIDLPEEFDSFSELVDFMEDHDDKDTALAISKYIDFLNEILAQQFGDESEAYDEQALLRLLSCPLQYKNDSKKQLTLEDTFTDPVTVPSGYTYEREEIQRNWEEEHGDEPMPEGFLIPNIIIRQLAEELREKRDARLVNFDSLLEDPIQTEPLDKTMVMDTNGNTYCKEVIEKWLERSKTCPFNPGLPCTKMQLRANKLLLTISNFYEKHLEDPIDKLRKAVGVISDEQVKVELNDYFGRFESLKVSEDLLKHEKLKQLIDDLDMLFESFNNPQNPTALQDVHLDKTQIIECLLSVHKTLNKTVNDKPALLDCHDPECKRDFLSKLESFNSKIKLRQKCLDPADSAIFAKLKPDSTVKVDLVAIVDQRNLDASDGFAIVLKVRNENQAHIEAIAKIIANTVKSKPDVFIKDGFHQFQFSTARLGVVLLAFYQTKLIGLYELEELKEKMPELLRNLDELQTHQDIKKMLQRLDPNEKNRNRPGFFSRVSSFFKSPEDRADDSASSIPRGTGTYS